jgi:hypothetical protein
MLGASYSMARQIKVRSSKKYFIRTALAGSS